ncbi:MAG TPA: AMP-binding protein [Gemmatimonadales bacterium]|nr:AMP-binding protein [Gemmatimonadales bacterium]
MIFRSPYPDIDVPDVALHHFVLADAAARGERPALIEGPSGRTLSYAQLAAGMPRVAAGLAARGLKPGDVLALFAPNLPEYALAFYGALAAGAVVSPVSSLATVDDVTFQLRDAGARMLVTVPAFLDRARPAAERLGIEHLFVLGEAGDATPFATLLASDAPAPRPIIQPARDLAVLPYSSGTTGFPKGVLLTHRNLVANLMQTGVALHAMAQERIIAVLPFFHIYGLEVVLNLGLWRGSTLVTMPRFELEPFLDLLQRYAVSYAFVAPPVVLALARHEAVDRYNLSGLRGVFSGAAPLDAALQDACAQRMGCRVAQGYGLTEASPVTHATSDAPGRNRAGTIGELLPNTECRIVDVASGVELGPDQDGELLIRGPQVMRGYLNNPEATAATLDAAGWLHTGDIGHADRDGFFCITDRLKELIKYKGFQVPPAELEAVLRTHPAVADAAVIPIPDCEAGEVPKALVVLKGAVSPEDLMAYVAERVAPYKRLHAVETIDAIPKSPAGKILRRVLRDRERVARV